jgi:hypothetical protein
MVKEMKRAWLKWPVALSIRPSHAKYTHTGLTVFALFSVAFCWNSDALSGETQVNLYFGH